MCLAFLNATESISSGTFAKRPHSIPKDAAPEKKTVAINNYVLYFCEANLLPVARPGTNL